MRPEILPSWLHHPTEESILVTDEATYMRLWSEGWRDTPLAFLEGEEQEEEPAPKRRGRKPKGE